MSYKKTITPWLLALWLVLSLAGCASEAGDDAPTPADLSKRYLQVMVNVNGEKDSFGSRADDDDDKYHFSDNPSGGESGDGDDKGLETEYTVTNLNLLLYSSSNNDMKDDNAIIDKVVYFEHFSQASGGNKNGTSWISGIREIPNDIVPKNFHLLVVANAGDMTSSWSGKKLKEVRDLLVTKVCNRNMTDIEKSSAFLMSSLKDAQLVAAGHLGSFEDPYLVDVNIERLAARIDIMPNAYRQYDKKTKTYTYNYNVTNSDGALLGGFVLEYVMPYNDISSGEYLIKRVTDLDDKSSVNYNSEETEDVNRNSTNYVICPWNNDRVHAAYFHDKKTIDEWESIKLPDFYRTKEANRTHSKDNDNPKVTPYNVKFYTLDYIQENTSFDNDVEHATGLVFKGTYYDKAYWQKGTEEEIASGIFGKPTDVTMGTPKAYTYVIRHSDPDGNGTTSDPMHYGIVRNNIYRVRIDGVTGKGPDGMKITLNVVPWARYEHDEVIY